ncbi:sodium:calcium antiporter [Aeromicrobium choanae]|uniref:Cation:H+ antiporter n=1 Tax=Aeromicrobium choanae TaxID=1736691 RepID=A0A1T4Z278_9ACTN|nr:sodium:calcium antiporter [Aeromicrobium choanae]SKB08056.1 cation:H+ antiporter [Aeromicrobium choanae]
MAVLLVVAGLATLIVGAELLVRGGSGVATRLGIPPMVIGLTVVSIGTSLPELAIGIDAALRGAGPLAVGNIAGTNIVNLLLILGLSAAIAPLAIQSRTIAFELPVVAAVSILVVLLALDGSISRVDGTVLVTIAVLYTVAVVALAVRDPSRVPAASDGSGGGLVRHLVMLAAGLGIVVLGADWLVRGAVDLAAAMGVSEVVIGLTVVAIGSSAPELVTTVVSTLRGDRDIAVGNLIGSSVYNLALILGVTSLVAPLEVTSDLIRVDLPLMALVAVLLLPVMATGRRVSRAEGVAAVAAYVLYLGVILTTRT